MGFDSLGSGVIGRGVLVFAARLVCFRSFPLSFGLLGWSLLVGSFGGIWLVVMVMSWVSILVLVVFCCIYVSFSSQAVFLCSPVSCVRSVVW